MLLMTAIGAQRTIACGCVRVEWTAENDCADALALYGRPGARWIAEKIYHRFEGEMLPPLAAGAWPAMDEAIGTGLAGRGR